MAGVAAFVVCLTAMTPARVISLWLTTGPVQASGFSGTLWRGHSQSVRYENLVVTNLRWRLRTSRLLAGRLALDIEARVPDGFADGRLELAAGGRLSLEQFRFRSSLTALGAGLNLALEGGTVTADLQTLHVASGWFTRLNGTLSIDGLSLEFPGLERMPPGSFVVTFDNPAIDEANPLQGQVRGSDGVLQIDASLTLEPPADYLLFGTALPAPGAPEELVRALAMLGPRGADGSYEFGLAGSL